MMQYLDAVSKGIGLLSVACYGVLSFVLLYASMRYKELRLLLRPLSLLCGFLVFATLASLYAPGDFLTVARFLLRFMVVFAAASALWYWWCDTTAPYEGESKDESTTE